MGLDADQSSIDRARQNAATARSSRVEFVCGRLEKLSCRSFHVVICSEVVEHVSSPADFLSAIHPILMKSGVLILTVPNGYGYFEFESAFTRVSPKFPYFAERFERWLVRTFGSSRLRNRHYVEYGGLDSDRDRQRNELEQSSLAIDQTHYQRFTPKKIRGVIAEGGFEITSFQNNTFLAGNILNALIRSSDRLLLLNGRLADFLPHRMAADWLIAARKTVRSVDRSFVASCGVE